MHHLRFFSAPVKALPHSPLRSLCLRSRTAAVSEMGPNSQRGGRGRFDGGRGRGGGGGGRGGGQRWWDPAWRAERLKQMREEGPKAEVLNEQEWWQRLQAFKSATEPEIVVKENYGRTGAETLENMAQQLGLFFHAYNKGRNTVLVLSKVPLPNYRADLDERHGQSQRNISLSLHAELHVENMLAKTTKQPSSSRQSAATAESARGSSVALDVAELPDTSVDKDRISAELKSYQIELQKRPSSKAMRSFREKLPASKMKMEFLQAVAKNQVLVVSGETGCGKTTQLPQFILEEEIEAGRGADCEIICTQPRRISAISVASRVASERGDDIGDTVGYQIRLETRRSVQTRLLFCTTGVLLRRLVNDPLLKGVSHVMVDEIHERGMNEDFLLIILRDLLPRRPDLRLVLMSATINAEMFSAYFNGAPRMHIPGFTFPVKEFFLEDVLQITGHVISMNQQGARQTGSRRRPNEPKKDPITDMFENVVIEDVYENYSKSTQASLRSWNIEQIDLELVEAVVEYICTLENQGAILVFLTGWDDISKLLEKLKSNPTVRSNLIIPLHGSMPTVNQREIFQRPPTGVRKIVLATNIAETSITIDDVVYVVDCGKAKETSYDALNKLACLLPAWISKAASHQRRGRAGRVQPGICYHLYPRVVYDAMADYQQPEIIRTPLESLSLQIKNLELGKVASFLSKALQPPEPLAVQNAIELLKTIEALNENEDLTSLGRHLAKLPLDPKVAKMLLLGAIFKCLGPALTIAAALAYRDPFVIPIDRKAEADKAKGMFAGSSRSDHIGLMNAYEGYIVAKRKGQERKFCWESFLSAPTLQWMEDARSQFMGLLMDIGFVEKSLGFEAYNSHGDDLEMIRAILCAGLYPNVVQCKRRGKRTAFFTKEDGKVEPHPSSVNSRMNDFPCPWLIYSEKVKTSGIYLRDSTNISDYALLLFGGPLVPTSGGVEMLDGYLQFSASPKTMELVNGLRQQLDSLLKRKIDDPKFDLHLEGKHVVSAVLALLHSGGSSKKQVDADWEDERNNRYRGQTSGWGKS